MAVEVEWPRPHGVAPELDWTELHQLLSDPHETTEAEVLAAIERHPEQARVQHAVR